MDTSSNPLIMHINVANMMHIYLIHIKSICKLKLLNITVHTRRRFGTLMCDSVLKLNSALGALNIDISTDPSIAGPGPTLHLEVAKLFGTYLPINKNGIFNLKVYNEMHIRPRFGTSMCKSILNLTPLGALNIDISTNPSKRGRVLRPHLEVARLYYAYSPLHNKGICKLQV